jgi:hypothetical protein
MRAADDPSPQAPRDGGDDGSSFEVFGRSYGPDASLAEYLIERIRQWDAAGRPPDEQKLRIRIYPPDTDYTPLPNEIVFDRRITRLVIDW